MTTKSDAEAQHVGLNATQGMALGLGLVAAEAAGAAASRGGYRLTGDDRQRVTRAISQAVLAMVGLVEDWSATTDEQLEGAARALGERVLYAVLGPPPMAQ